MVVRTETFMNCVVGANHHHYQEVVEKHYSQAMTTSCQTTARQKRRNRILTTTHRLHCGYANPNMTMMMLLQVVVVGATTVLLCSLPSWTLLSASAFVVVTPFHNNHNGHNGQFVGNSPAKPSLRAVSQQQPWTITLRAAATNDDSSISSRRRSSQQKRAVARASSAIDSSDANASSSSSRTRPKIRQTTTTTLKLQQQQRQLPMQHHEEEEESIATTLSVVVPEYRRGGGNNNDNNINPRRMTKKKKKSFASSSEFSFYDALMKDHEILTRSQELKLGRAVQRAKPLQVALERLMQDKRIEQQQLKLNFDNDDDDDDSDEYEHHHHDNDCNSDDVSNFSFAWKRREELEKASWLASCWQQEGGDEEEDGLGDKNNMPNADTLLLETLFAAPPRFNANSRVVDDDDDEPSPADVSSIYITDEDVVLYMNLPGGRAELQSILWSGIVARDTLIRSNIRLVVSIAKKWALQQTHGVGKSSYYNSQYLRAVYLGGWDRPSLDEAVQEGIVGLADAVQRYDPSRNLRFATYATFWITNSIRKCFQSASTTCLRVPASYHDIKSRFNSLVRDHYNNQIGNGGEYYSANLLAAAAPGQTPSLDVLANELGITKGRLQRVLRATKPLLSLDQPRGMGMVKSDGDNQGDLVLADSLSTDDYDNGGGRHTTGGGGLLPTSMEQGVELSFLRRSLENALATELAPYERDIVRLRLGLDDGVSRTAKQVVAAYGGDLSETEVRLAEKRAFSKLRSPHALSTYKFLNYLDFAGIDKETATLR